MSNPITAGMTGPEASAAEQSRMELQARLNGLGGLNGRKLDPETKAKKLREACEGFESIFIQKMWQEMRNAVPKTGMLTGREERYWQDMYDQELSKSMTKAGGIGLADMMYEQLSANLVSASRTTAGPASGSVFTPSAAPLLPENEVLAEISKQQAASIYDGEAPDTGTLADQANPEVIQVAAAASAPVNQTPASPVQPVSQIAQASEPVAPLKAETTAPAAANRPTKSQKHIHAADLGQSSALINAQKAKRDAGDKLGAFTVRPAQNRPRASQATETTTSQPEFAPGSAEALKAAVENARTGAPASTVQPINLNTLVANLQSGQLSSDTEPSGEAAEPVVRKTRFSTNIPKNVKNSRNNKKNNQAIRLLNTDNVGPNSKAGQGLAAYHAQQAEKAQAAQQVPPLTAQETDNLAATQSSTIPPLTAQNQMGQTDAQEGNFAIPPLTAADLRS